MGRPINHPSEIGMIEVFEFSSFDIAEMYSAKYGEKYYMNTPWRYIYRRVFRLSLLLFALSLCSSIYLIFPLVPFYISAYFKVTNFADWCQTINLSQRKLKLLFLIELIIFEIIALFIRRIFVDMIIVI